MKIIPIRGANVLTKCALVLAILFCTAIGNSQDPKDHQGEKEIGDDQKEHMVRSDDSHSAVVEGQKEEIDLSEWQLVWADEFDYDDSKLEENWVSQNGPSSHILCSRWRENAKVHDGIVELTARKEKRGGQDWTAASLWTHKKFKYGYFECRYKYAGGETTNNSFWLMTRDEDPEVGKRFEIDINEGHYPKTINTNIHNHSDHVFKNGKKISIRNPKHFVLDDEYDTDFSEEFHTYGLKWNKEELIFYFDRKEIRRVKNEFCFSETPIWLSLALVSWYGTLTDAVDGQSMKVDYVRYYQPKND